ncbi:unnamed protein product [Rotaria magnacalcarata]|uniref:Transposase n=1 Tax=Rotaria magnacalcarata TaxID=392030 RepID=A0A820WDZ0_9BILA|nr:unnamed protein product [Rotaria magnacalcarata]CAF1683614.1 unnamed protein product [Rotaria magnacalcarata]CAF1933933.1 unnamed protein product [Rotaria magnacalcarata]CAF2036799.1 unnamed protein product [Rotaria magnacalcarata]CAF2040104.1 unnamed protein product [Rotaria magnacalcarata]
MTKNIFLLQNKSVPANRRFYLSDRHTTAADVKSKRTKKCEPNLLVWITLFENGISKPFFSKQKQTVTQKAYLNNCVKARLIPLIDCYHTKEKVLFWPDLSSSHYGHDVIHYLNSNKVKLVPIAYNPQNCAQSRPIETLWSIINDMVDDNGWETKTIDQLKRRAIAKFKEIDLKLVQTMLSGV